MSNRVLGVLLTGVLLLGACSEDPEPAAAPPVADETPAPTYDPGLEPAAAALVLVPDAASVLVVTDYDELRLQLGYADLTGAAPARRSAKFWRRAERTAVLFSPGLLRPADGLLRSQYDVSQDDVSWEAQFATPTGAGWVIKLRDDLDLAGVQRAVDDGVGPLAGATVDAARSLVSLGAAAAPSSSWAADPARAALVGGTAVTTYVDTACLPYDEVFAGSTVAELAPAPAAELTPLGELEDFAVAYGTELVTVHLGAGRSDVFDRARLADVLPQTDPDFALGYVDPVADPGGGRIGYRLGDPAVAETLARERHLPFAVCAP